MFCAITLCQQHLHSQDSMRCSSLVTLDAMLLHFLKPYSKSGDPSAQW